MNLDNEKELDKTKRDEARFEAIALCQQIINAKNISIAQLENRDDYQKQVSRYLKLAPIFGSCGMMGLGVAAGGLLMTVVPIYPTPKALVLAAIGLGITVASNVAREISKGNAVIDMELLLEDKSYNENLRNAMISSLDKKGIKSCVDAYNIDERDIDRMIAYKKSIGIYRDGESVIKTDAEMEIESDAFNCDSQTERKMDTNEIQPEAQVEFEGNDKFEDGLEINNEKTGQKEKDVSKDFDLDGRDR